MRGHTGLGLTPSGGWSPTEQYYNFVDENGVPHVSMIYEDNMFWVATRDNINSKPTWEHIDREPVSTNSDWAIALHLKQSSDGIIFEDNQSLEEIRQG